MLFDNYKIIIGIVVSLVILVSVVYVSLNSAAASTDIPSRRTIDQINDVMIDNLGDDWPYIIIVLYAMLLLILYLVSRSISTPGPVKAGKELLSTDIINISTMVAVLALSGLVIYLAVDRYTHEFDDGEKPYVNQRNVKNLTIAASVIAGIFVIVIMGRFAIPYLLPAEK